MLIKKKEKTYETVFLALLQRAEIFLARPTHLNPTHAMKLERVLCTNWLARACRKGHSLTQFNAENTRWRKM